MRDAIARTLSRVLSVLPWTRRPAPGRHTAEHFAEPTESTPVSIWAVPWGGPSSAEAREVFRNQHTVHLTPQQRERVWAAEWAERGYDYRYVWDGGHTTNTTVAA